MPIYEYACDACGKETEVIQGMNEKPLRVCPHCGQRKLKKLMSVPAIQFKGSGFHVTDYASADRTAGLKKSEGEKSEGAGKSDKAEKPESAGKSEKVEKKAEKVEKGEKKKKTAD